MSNAWSGDWKARVLDRAQRRGFSSLLALFQANPGIPFGQVFQLLRDTETNDDNAIAYSQVEAVYFEEAAHKGILRDAVADVFVRKMREHLRNGWKRGKQIRERQASVMSRLELPAKCLTGISMYNAPIWETLLELNPPDDWCPENPDDPVIQELFERIWPSVMGVPNHQD